ncbi:Crp/Fnr family transcriptional regulator [Rhodoferax sp.]|uniref:Crp/Fnr family transcriptional regulator n=1 Tax=Rhodoferax sp. TaxID=50421 RepID=UPI0026225B2A|nr:Crp/Fnr family transcriptional regulator [Rhodoferax sp.]MDD2808489.1 Crp/Fnr family transcriptional regulator [Rhodoferax sp.]MDD4943803.1 Crp/Fnr family transcriptional regulator [Rhodoferax sp.]MDD5479313.1 Crp/Fnr family transcriptional regulator [Rhodoferax sp.]
MHHTFFNMPDFLASSPLFSGLSSEELVQISQSCMVANYTKGEMVFMVGHACDAFHIVVSGQVKLFVVSPSGHEKVIELISPGQSFAEALVFLNRPYILSAQALVETTLVNVSKQGVYSAIAQDPQFAMHMLAGISRRLHGLVQDVEGYALQNGLQRLIGYLLRDVDANHLPDQSTLTVALPANKSTIASRLSLTPEYFSRVLHDLEHKQLIHVDRREIRILDVKKLVNYGAA